MASLVGLLKLPVGHKHKPLANSHGRGHDDVHQRAMRVHSQRHRLSARHTSRYLEAAAASTSVGKFSLHVYPIFNLQRGRLGLPPYMAGVGLRAWREHRHAAFVGMVAQSCASAQLQFGRVTRGAYPALTWLVNTTAEKMEAGVDEDFWDYVGSSPAALMVGDLARAWGASVDATKEAFPALQ